MKDSISSNQSTSGTYSSSLDDLTSLSSISSELTSLEPISSNQSTISSCNKSLLDEDKCNYMSSDLETLASPSLLINRELRQRLTMLSSDFDESDSKSDSLDTLSGNLSDMSDPSDEDNSSQSGMVKELYEHSIVHKTYDNLEEAEITNHFNNFEHLEGSDCEFSTKSTLKSNLSAEASDNSSISVADDDPAAIQQFKDMIKKQKIYLDSLQRELFRLQKMEQTLSKLHKKSKLQKEMLKKIEICDNCEGICNSACQLPSNSKKAPDVVSKLENLNRNNYPLTNYESSNENRIEKEQCVNYHSSVKVKSDATTQTKPSEYTRENNIVNFPTKKERIHQIHDKVDQIIHKLHAATTMDPDEPYHSIGVQTSNLVAPSQEINRKMNKSACKFASSTMDRSQKKAVYWTIPANEHKLDASSTKFNNFLSDYHQTEVLYPGSTNVSLQQAFRERCSHVLKNSESRVDRINIKSEMRKANTDCRFEQLDFMYKRDHDIIGNNGPDKVKVIKPRKIFTEKEMRKQTERLYSHLPEIKKLKEEKMKQQNGKTNRLVAKIFSQRLKSNAVHGKVTFPLTQKLTQI